MLVVSSGTWYLAAGVVLMALTVVLRQPTAARSLSALLFLVGGFNLLVDKEVELDSSMLVPTAVVLITLLAISYAYLCASILREYGLKTRWQLALMTYLPILYAIFLGVFVVWGIETAIERRGLALYIFVVFALSIHLPLFASSIVKMKGTTQSVLVSSLAPRWFWIAFALVAVLGPVAELLGRRDVILLLLNMFVSALFAAPFMIMRYRSRAPAA